MSIACTRHGVDKRSEIQRRALGYLMEEYLEFQRHDTGCDNALIRPSERVCKDTPHRSTVELDRSKEEFVASHVLALPSSLPVANMCSAELDFLRSTSSRTLRAGAASFVNDGTCTERVAGERRAKEQDTSK